MPRRNYRSRLVYTLILNELGRICSKYPGSEVRIRTKWVMSMLGPYSRSVAVWRRVYRNPCVRREKRGVVTVDCRCITVAFDASPQRRTP